MNAPLMIHSDKDSTGARTTFTVGIGHDGSIVFNYGTYYPRYANFDSREIDEWVSVPASAFPLLANILGVTSDEPAHLLQAVATHVRDSSQVRSTRAVTVMLDLLQVPYAVSMLIDRYD